MIHSDEDIRAVLSPLGDVTATAAELRALREPPRGSRSPWARRALIVSAGAAAIAAGAAVLPGGDASPGGAPLAPLEVAAATADTAPESPWPYRYTHTRTEFTFAGGRNVTTEQEAWVGARWRGRSRTTGLTRAEPSPLPARKDGTPIALRGDAKGLHAVAELGSAPVEGGRIESAYPYGDGPLARLDPSTLPDDREAIRRVLEDGIRDDRWGPYPQRSALPSDQVVKAVVAREIVLLLVRAPLTGDQRAALLDVLARSAEARDLGRVRDGSGRQGQGVELVLPRPTLQPMGPADADRPTGDAADRLRVIFDQDTAEILEWSFTPSGGVSSYAPRSTETVLASGGTNRIGRRP